MGQNRNNQSDFFYAWERRGRGRLSYSIPVRLEPPFVPFDGHGPSKAAFQDDTLETGWQALNPFRSTKGQPGKHSGAKGKILDLAMEKYPLQTKRFPSTSPGLVELQVAFSKRQNIDIELMEQLLSQCSAGAWPVAFEIIGTTSSIIIQFAIRANDESLLVHQLNTFFPTAVIRAARGYLEKHLNPRQGSIIDLSYATEFIRPLAMPRRLDQDPLTGCYAILESLQAGEVGGLQVLFQSTKEAWLESIQRSVLNKSGKPFFPDSPEMIPLVKEKTAFPLFAVTVKTFGVARDQSQSYHIAKRLALALKSATAYTGSNHLSLLRDKVIAPRIQAEDLLQRHSHRLGMLMNSREVVGMVHFPPPTLSSKKLAVFRKTVSAPNLASNSDYVIGIDTHQGKQQPVGLSTSVRQRHIHILGKTGQGKSTLLVNLITQDISHGNGVAVFDPHGDLIEDIIARIPTSLKDKVVLVDPADTEYAIGVNLLEAHKPQEKARLASDLNITFKRYTQSWGQQMEMIFAKAVGAFVKSSRGGTLVDLYRFLTDASFRKEFLDTIQDPLLLDYWRNRFPKVKGPSASLVADRIDAFLSKDIVRYMMMQPKGLDFRKILDSGSILLLRLSHGDTDPTTSSLLGALILRKLYIAALSRVDTHRSKRRPFYVYLDEFQNFVTEDLGSMLSEIRKFGVGLVLANQFVQQITGISSAVGASMFNNPDTRICFNLGTPDARQMITSFPEFDVHDLTTLKMGQVIVYSAGENFTLDTIRPKPVPPGQIGQRLAAIRAASRRNFATPVDTLIQQELASFRQASSPSPTPATPVTPVAPAPTLSKSSPGKSSADHNAMKAQVMKLARERGFIPDPEARTPDKTGYIDVALTKGPIRVAFEVGATNRNQYEAQNIIKCINAGYHYVVFFSNNPKRFPIIQKLIKDTLKEPEFRRVYFADETTLATILDSLTPPEPAQMTISVQGEMPADKKEFWDMIMQQSKP